MSLGYAEKLSYREDVGEVGMSEIFDSPQVLQEKIKELATMIRESKSLVAFTGAGISTSCGIPDFRGPKGVWTLQREGKGVPEASIPFDRAMPALTHMALVELERSGILKFVISQNVDSLHLRSGIPRDKLSELHGNSFREICPSCGLEYVRDFEIETIGMKKTSRHCSDSNCRKKLKDTVLDWEDALPIKEMVPAENHCRAADLVLCLGTSLQITPACNLPLKAIRGGGKIVIINLQPTPKDKKASLVIRGMVDKVIAGVMDILNLRIPPYIRIDFVQLSLSYSSPKKNYVKWIVRIASIHGTKAPLPFVKSVEISFSGRPDLKAAFLQKQPLYLKRETARNKPFKMILKFNLGDGCGCPCTSIEWEIDFQAKKDSFILDKEEVVRKLRDGADEESRCGQTAVIRREALPRAETSVHAMVTNMMRYGNPEAGHEHKILSNSFINEAAGQSPQNSFKVTKRGSEGAGDREASLKKPKLTEAAPPGAGDREASPKLTEAAPAPAPPGAGDREASPKKPKP